MKTIVTLALICVAALLVSQLRNLGRKGKTEHESTYKKKSSLLSEAESRFFETLLMAADGYAVCPKVRVSDVIESSTGSLADFRKISQKHFDWVLCNPVTMEPLAAVELDDSSHLSGNSITRDRTKNEAAESALLPLVRFKCKSTYSIEEVRRSLKRTLNGHLG